MYIAKNDGFSKCAKQNAEINTVRYIGIAIDEPKRLARLDGVNKRSPIAEIGWTEDDCMEWCIENDLRSPHYDFFGRGGCWFCPNRKMDELRYLRKHYPEYWELLLKWDADSPISFKADGHTVRDIDKRIRYEECGFVPKDRRFRWSMLDNEIMQF